MIKCPQDDWTAILAGFRPVSRVSMEPGSSWGLANTCYIALPCLPWHPCYQAGSQKGYDSSSQIFDEKRLAGIWPYSHADWEMTGSQVNTELHTIGPCGVRLAESLIQLFELQEAKKNVTDGFHQERKKCGKYVWPYFCCRQTSLLQCSVTQLCSGVLQVLTSRESHQSNGKHCLLLTEFIFLLSLRHCLSVCVTFQSLQCATLAPQPCWGPRPQ